MRRLIIILLFVVLLAGCSRESQPLPESTVNLTPKPAASSSYFQSDTIKPIQESNGIAMISEWFDEDTILYVEEKDQLSTLKKYHLYSGLEEPFFETEEWITEVEGNEDLTLFSIVTYDEFDQSSMYVIDAEGNRQLELQHFGDSYTVYWNPYKPSEMMLITYLPDWNFDVFHVNVDEQTVTAIEIPQTYFQWVNETQIAYLNWDAAEPNYEAPLVLYDLGTGEAEEMDKPLITFMSYSDHTQLEVSVDSMYELYTTYTFKSEGAEEISELEMPILNTYSDLWWIPFHMYDSDEGDFYYLRPKYSGDYFSYEDGYNLLKYNPRTNAEVSITELDDHLPIKLSPNGGKMLIGNRLEEVMELKNKEKVTLF
ncbi:putative lipoprotein [Alkalihalophilus pseudofirmus OF4]|uniref:Lipoprotein n=1 Tax=Alkalihalophilus pseudofirmus (strain ATCC BAA-2126 / JCM 17055 / OF4) TaxID=398511 RepID=D3FYK3_ALKPO|nr:MULTISPECIES: membrane lipoprotein lipid attachment site-containing protein [Alkalihalophilus]ADC50855.1 putative lipoprotein [Alkalihalophilus pseudofirmus OF4]MED1601229.1 membrane lipoprotein lipid attachment site-containing protein [Alkalihalophilus marmarensis]